MADKRDELAKLTAGIVAAYVSANDVAVEELPGLIASVHGALSGASTPAESDAARAVDLPTAAQIRKSITFEALISFIDGRPYRTLKRHVGKHGLSVEEYRTRYGLPADYPMSAPSYSAARSAMAKASGLGKGGRQAKNGAKKRKS